jgi:putative ABC transport system ATP-binding protein
VSIAISRGPTGRVAGERDNVLELRGVTKEYPGTPPVPALRGLDLEIARGEIVAVVGPSGSGKSTLLHIAGTLDRPTSGEVFVAGYDISKLDDASLSALRAQHIGFVFQQFYLIDTMSALDNVADGLLYSGRTVAERRDLARTALGRVGLAHRVDHDASKLSGGERQRVAVARALVGNPSFVLADEPTGNLDSHSSDAIVELLEELNRHGTTIIVITHNPEVAARFPRRVGIRDGRVEYDERS